MRPRMLRQDFPPLPPPFSDVLNAPALLRRFGLTALIKHDPDDEEIKSAPSHEAMFVFLHR